MNARQQFVNSKVTKNARPKAGAANSIAKGLITGQAGFEKNPAGGEFILNGSRPQFGGAGKPNAGFKSSQTTPMRSR